MVGPPVTVVLLSVAVVLVVFALVWEVTHQPEECVWCGGPRDDPGLNLNGDVCTCSCHQYARSARR